MWVSLSNWETGRVVRRDTIGSTSQVGSGAARSTF